MNESTPRYHDSLISRRSAAAPLPADMKERLQQLQHHQRSEMEPVASTPPPHDKKREPHDLQGSFLKAHQGRLVTLYTISGLKLVGKLKAYDQYTVLIEGNKEDVGPLLVFKHSISTINASFPNNL